MHTTGKAKILFLIYISEQDQTTIYTPIKKFHPSSWENAVRPNLLRTVHFIFGAES